MQEEEVSAVIVTHNSAKYICRCIESLLSQKNTLIREIIVVDNNSNDNTIDLVKEYARKDGRIKIIKLYKNLGFPFGCNIGAKHVTSMYIIFLNPDVILEQYCLFKLKKFLDNNPNVASVQPLLLNLNGCIESSGGIMDILGHGFHTNILKKEEEKHIVERKDILYTSFACSMVRRNVYLKLGGLDPYYFLYNEDLDFGWRCWLAGYTVSCVSDAIAYHIGGHAVRKVPYRALYFARRNRLFTVFSNYELPLALLTLLLLIGLYVASIFIIALKVKDKTETRLMINIIINFFKKLKYSILKRKQVIRIKRISNFRLFRKKLIQFKLIGVLLFWIRSYRRQFGLN